MMGKHISIGALAKAAGLSVKTVRLYEHHGLIAAIRAANGRRMFDDNQLERLQLIAALKRIGLTLTECRRVLEGKADIPAAIIQRQAEALAARREDIEWSLAVLTEAQREAPKSHAIGSNALQRLHASANAVRSEPSDAALVARYYDKSQLVRLCARRPAPAAARAIHCDWQELFAEVEALAACASPPPADVQRAARRWNELLLQFTRDDADIAASLQKQAEDGCATLTDREKHIPTTPTSLSKRGWRFISQALAQAGPA